MGNRRLACSKFAQAQSLFPIPISPTLSLHQKSNLYPEFLDSEWLSRCLACGSKALPLAVPVTKRYWAGAAESPNRNGGGGCAASNRGVQGSRVAILDARTAASMGNRRLACSKFAQAQSLFPIPISPTLSLHQKSNLYSEFLDSEWLSRCLACGSKALPLAVPVSKRYRAGAAESPNRNGGGGCAAANRGVQGSRVAILDARTAASMGNRRLACSKFAQAQSLFPIPISPTLSLHQKSNLYPEFLDSEWLSRCLACGSKALPLAVPATKRYRAGAAESPNRNGGGRCAASNRGVRIYSIIRCVSPPHSRLNIRFTRPKNPLFSASNSPFICASGSSTTTPD
jgi:uncharacterized protein YqiB (DUF1249 family)